MKYELECVREFHTKHDQAKGYFPYLIDFSIANAGSELLDIATILDRKLKLKFDLRVLRAQLICEEAGEALKALGHGSEVQFLDALADLIYVILGSAVAYDLPIIEAFKEVHTSNMTKEKKDAGRIRNKGTSYIPPNLEKVLHEWRSRH